MLTQENLQEQWKHNAERARYHEVREQIRPAEDWVTTPLTIAGTPIRSIGNWWNGGESNTAYFRRRILGGR